jgi:hypothetical protein
VLAPVCNRAINQIPQMGDAHDVTVTIAEVDYTTHRHSGSNPA